MCNRLEKSILSVAASVVIFALGICAPAAQAAPLVLNGDFETGDLTSWTLGGFTNNTGVCQSGQGLVGTTCIVNGGSYAMSFGQGGGNFHALLSQEISTTIGSKYDLSFFLANDDPNNQPDETFDVFWGGASVFSLLSPQGSFPYTQKVALNLTATTGLTQLQFKARHDPSYWFLDDVSVIEVQGNGGNGNGNDNGNGTVPEPASLVLFGVSAVGLGAWRARRRRQ